MSPSRRDREYAKRRYEKWQNKQLARQERQRRTRRTLLAAGGAVVTVTLVAVGAYWLIGSSDSGTPPAASACGTPSTATPQAKSWPNPPAKTLAEGKTWQWTLDTNCGKITVALDGAKAPQAVSSTIFLSQQGFYTNTPCHRLTTQGIYVLQCGDPTGSGTGGPGYTYGPVENAPKNDVYPAGTVAMARQGGNGSSMGSQFFLVYKDSPIPSDTAGGYTVLGRITTGLDVVNKIAAAGVSGGGSDGAPTMAVSIVSTAVKPE